MLRRSPPSNGLRCGTVFHRPPSVLSCSLSRRHQPPHRAAHARSSSTHHYRQQGVFHAFITEPLLLSAERRQRIPGVACLSTENGPHGCDLDERVCSPSVSSPISAAHVFFPVNSFAMMNPSAYPFSPAQSSHPPSQSDAAPSSSSSSSSMGGVGHGGHPGAPRRPVMFRAPSNAMYHTAPASSFSASVSAAGMGGGSSMSPITRLPFHAPGELVDDLPTSPLSMFHSQLRGVSGHSHTLPPRGYDSLASTASTMSSSSSSYPASSPQSSPPYSPRDDLSPLHSTAPSRFGSAQLSLVHDSHHADRSRRLSDSSGSSPFPHASLSSISYSSSPSSAQSASSPTGNSIVSLSSSGVVIDPRAQDPERLHALLSVVFHMESSGAHAKFLSQLGILYKQMYPQLFVKGMLKDLVDYAVTSGLLKLTGPAGQQQVHLTSKARSSGAQQPPLLQQIGFLPSQLSSGPIISAQSPSPESSPSGNSPPVMTYGDEDDGFRGLMQQTRPRSGSIVGSVGSGGIATTRNARAQSVQYGHSARGTPTTSPQLSAASSPFISGLPPLSIAPAMTPSLPPFGSSTFHTPQSTSGGGMVTLEEKYFRGEKTRHLRYMFHFRVHACKAALTKSCTAGDSLKKPGQSGASSGSDCFDHHSASKTRRRLPRIVTYSNGTFWSYNACRCQAIEKEIKCEKSLPFTAPHSACPRPCHRPNLPACRVQSCRVNACAPRCWESHPRNACPHERSLTIPSLCAPRRATRADTATTRRRSPTTRADTRFTIRLFSAGRPTIRLLLTDPRPSLRCPRQTAPCSYPARPDGVCTRFGLHCAYAHGEDDIRRPIVLKQGMPHKLLLDDPNNAAIIALNQAAHLYPSVSAGEPPFSHPQSRRGSINGEDTEYGQFASADASAPSFGAVPAQLLDPDDFMTPRDALMADRSFYLYQYKVRPCSDPTPACSQGSCPHYHYDNKRRRSPRLFKYSHEACPSVKPDGGGQWKRPSCCPLGDSCTLAHTLLEAMYHPEVYKTVLCSNFDEREPTTWRRCQWGRMCAHAHSKLELDFNDQCQRMGEPAAMQTFARQMPAGIAQQSHSAVIVYDTDDVHAPLPAPPLGLFYRDGKPKDTKPPLPPMRPTSSSNISYSSPTPLHHTSSVLSPLTSPSSMAALWGKPTAANGSAFSSSPISASAPSSNSSSPAPTATGARPLPPMHSRTVTPVSADLSYFTPLGPTVLRDDVQAAERSAGDDDAIIIPSSNFSTASTVSSPTSSTFLSPAQSSLHSWQSTPSGSLTPSSAVQPLFGDMDDHAFDSSFLDSHVPRAERPSGASPIPSAAPPASSELHALRCQLKEASARAVEVRAENAVLRKQLASMELEKAAIEEQLAALTTEIDAQRNRAADLRQPQPTSVQAEASGLRSKAPSPSSSPPPSASTNATALGVEHTQAA